MINNQSNPMKCFNFKKVKKVCFNSRTLIIVLAVLVIVGFGLAVYFGVKANNLKKEFSGIGPREKLEKINSYVVILEKFEEFKRKEGRDDTTTKLERAVLATNSGVLKSLFDEMIFGGNLKKDMEYFLDAVIDSLKLFSQIK